MKPVNKLLCGFALSVVLMNGSAVFAKNCFDFPSDKFQSIFYINDIHGQLPTMLKITNASTQFDACVADDDDIDSFKFSSGDIYIGSDDMANTASTMFLNVNEIQA